MNANQNSNSPLLQDEGEDELQAGIQDADSLLRHVHRDRSFGIGYGNSSGYGSTLHFTDGHADALFRFR